MSSSVVAGLSVTHRRYVKYGDAHYGGNLKIKTTSHDTPPDIAPEPEAEMAADFKVIGDVVTDDPQRDHDLRTPGPERPVVLSVDQGAEDLTAPRLAVLGAQYHPV